MNRRDKVLRVLELVDVEDSSINVQIEQKRPYTFVRLLATDAAKLTVGIGFSKVCFPDRWNSERGVEIAMAKAANALVDGAKREYYDKNDAS